MWLTECYSDPADPRDRIREIIDDRTESKTWLRAEWRRSASVTVTDSAVDELLEALYRQRIHIQLTYAAKNLDPNLHSPSTRARILHAVGDGSIVLVVFTALMGWLGHISGTSVLGLGPLVWTAIAAVLSACGLMARAADQGLQNEADADRYEWYADAVEEVRQRYESGVAAERIRELRRLEEFAYQELRRFLRTHNTARFMM